MARTTTDLLQGAGIALALVASSVGAEPVDTTWAELRQGRPQDCAAFLSGYLSRPDCAEQAVVARMMPSRFEQCSPGNAALEGREIRIAGYAHPLEFEFYGVQRFLLLPLLRQDCRHPPPPLPDQIISVDFPAGLNVTADPVWVHGILRLSGDRTHLAPHSYTLKATHVTPAVIPDVPEGG